MLVEAVRSVDRKSVGRLIRSLPRASPFGLPVCVARVPAAPLCETPHRSELASDADAPRFRIQAPFTNRRQVFRQFACVDQVRLPRIIGNSLAFAACFFVLL